MKNLPGMAYRSKNGKEWPMLYVSDGCLDLTGYSPEEFIERRASFGDIIFEEDRERVYDQTQKTINLDTPYQDIYRICSKDGQIKWVLEQGRRVITPGNEAIFEGYITDITEERLGQISSDLIADLLHQAPQISEPEKICLLVCQKLQQLLGRTLVAFSITNEDSNVTKPVGYFGHDELLEDIIKQFTADFSDGVRVRNILTAEEMEIYLSCKLLKYEHGLYELFSHNYPRSAFTAIEKNINRPDIYLIALTRLGKLFGNLLIITKVDIHRYVSTIENIITRATVIMDQSYSDSILRESEERFRRVFEESPIGIVLSNDQSIITNINPVFSTIIGYTPEEIIGHSFREFTHPEDLPENEKNQMLLTKVKIPYFTMQKRYLHKNGAIIWANITVTAIRDEKGGMISQLTMVEDITEKKKASELLQQHQYLMQSLMDNIPDMVFYKDLDSRFIRVNKAMASRFGAASEEELLGKTDRDFFVEDMCNEMLSEEREIIRTGIPMINRETVENWKDNRPITWSSVTKMPLRDKSGGIIGTFGVSRDITDRKIKEEEIKRLNADLEKRVEARTKELRLRNQELEAFTYSISHDLKAPLRGITGYSQLLLQEHSSQLDEEGKSFLNKLIFSSDQLNNLIDDLLAYTRMERRPVNRADFSMKEIVNIVLEERMMDIKDLKIRIHQQIDDGIIHNSSPELVTQILRNYLDNAIKFTSEKKAPEIWITYTHDEKKGLLNVRDNGVGFDPKYSEKIFEVFYRLYRIDQYPGTGIGLALVKKAADLLGDKVWGTGELKVGASFFLEIKSN